jgi:hypothetical protein
MRRSRIAQALLIAIGLVAGASRAVADDVPPGLASLMEGRGTIAADLAAQVALCSSRQDTTWPAFKGCVDWHSAVHGIWALVAYERATGDRQYASIVSGALAAEAIRAEREHLKRVPGFEMPYGRAWFLRLAIDYHRLTNTSDLLEMADDVANSLRDHFRRHGVERNSTAYDSASWALINLIDYTRYRSLGELRAEAEELVRKNFVEIGSRCPAELENGEFMAICTNWAALAARVMDKDRYAAWLERFIRANGLPEPITPKGAHSFGLNFSRAWGLWDMYVGDRAARAAVADAYSRHFSGGYLPKSNWRGDYRIVGHWVAQFGMFALQPLFGREAGR